MMIRRVFSCGKLNLHNRPRGIYVTDAFCATRSFLPRTVVRVFRNVPNECLGQYGFRAANINPKEMRMGSNIDLCNLLMKLKKLESLATIPTYIRTQNTGIGATCHGQ